MPDIVSRCVRQGLMLDAVRPIAIDMVSVIGPVTVCLAETVIKTNPSPDSVWAPRTYFKFPNMPSYHTGFQMRSKHCLALAKPKSKQRRNTLTVLGGLKRTSDPVWVPKQDCKADLILPKLYRIAVPCLTRLSGLRKVTYNW